MDVTIHLLEPLRVGSLLHVGPYHEIGPAFEKLAGIAGQAGLFGQPGVAMLGIYHDDPNTTPPNELRSHAAATVPEGTPVPEGLEEMVVPAGRYACYTHVGPYEGLPGAWQRLVGEWLPESGETWGTGASLERYLNDPGQVPPEQLRTELRIPLG